MERIEVWSKRRNEDAVIQTLNALENNLIQTEMNIKQVIDFVSCEIEKRDKQIISELTNRP